ncbi:rho GTPase-activating protein 18 [Caerostris darwini]|uniref:Rho GTPase-activating protein 18 n=1 Tax=Caerostris darwini TaxID=1538125 RepID=A0AAV4UPD4_9ARAC|nr:rho GTPase-activating protein 18 [Caerostris darwini]
MSIGNVAMIVAPNLFPPPRLKKGNHKQNDIATEVTVAAMSSKVTQLLIKYGNFLGAVPPELLARPGFRTGDLPINITSLLFFLFALKACVKVYVMYTHYDVRVTSNSIGIKMGPEIRAFDVVVKFNKGKKIGKKAKRRQIEKLKRYPAYNNTHLYPYHPSSYSRIRIFKKLQTDLYKSSLDTPQEHTFLYSPSPLVVILVDRPRSKAGRWSSFGCVVWKETLLSVSTLLLCSSRSSVEYG